MLLKISIIFITISYIGPSTFADPFIVGGDDASERQFPYIGRLTTRQNDHLGSASILNHKWLLSARIESDPCDILVIVGTIFISSFIEFPAKSYDIGLIINHEYDNSHKRRHNIAMLKTVGDIKFNSNVEPIPIYGGFIIPGHEAKICGWGLNSENNHPTVLQHLTVKISKESDCKRLYPDMVDANVYSFFCAESHLYQGLCTGDEGDPLAINGQLAGIGSLIYSYCGSGKPDGYTLVPFYKKWIDYVTTIH